MGASPTLLKELVPHTSRARIIFNPKTAPQADYYLKLLAAAAPALTLTLDVVPVDSADRIVAAITELAGQSNVGPSASMYRRRCSRSPTR